MAHWKAEIYLKKKNHRAQIFRYFRYKRVNNEEVCIQIFRSLKARYHEQTPDSFEW